MADPSRRGWLGLGSNLGDRAGLIAEAVRLLRATPGIDVGELSRLYCTPPWGDADQGEFLNAALAIRSRLDPHAFLDATQAIERQLGRMRSRRWGPRAIDIDILHLEGVELADERLALPHPLWRERAFVLVPLAEIEPDLVIGGIRISDRLAEIDVTGIQAVESCPKP
ncbi:2-amino-4-hydroxy-6-hydroxymethyldihydropteridine diphosphokinase [uncultured Enterovirga sp.]|uniref:2-amino-4-hydroxy-6- hydroxymethyldihydropteridine diphosphokinase n=1 Tax=uncultured Enterovirga sp. TaxID=2026352 RepID=UPI0035CBF562